MGIVSAYIIRVFTELEHARACQVRIRWAGTMVNGYNTNVIASRERSISDLEKRMSWIYIYMDRKGERCNYSARDCKTLCIPRLVIKA